MGKTPQPIKLSRLQNKARLWMVLQGYKLTDKFPAIDCTKICKRFNTKTGCEKFGQPVDWDTYYDNVCVEFLDHQK